MIIRKIIIHTISEEIVKLFKNYRVDSLLKIGTHDNEKTNTDAHFEKIHLNWFNMTTKENDIAILELIEEVKI